MTVIYAHIPGYMALIYDCHIRALENDPVYDSHIWAIIYDANI